SRRSVPAPTASVRARPLRTRPRRRFMGRSINRYDSTELPIFPQPARRVRPARLDAEMPGEERGVGGELGRPAGEDDASLRENDALVRDLAERAEVLVDDDGGDAR